DPGRAIDVTLDKMPANPTVGRERAFQIDRAIAAQGFEICAIQRLVQQVERELIAALPGDGQATSVNGHAVTDRNTFGQAWRFNLKFCASLARPDPERSSDFLD